VCEEIFNDVTGVLDANAQGAPPGACRLPLSCWCSRPPRSPA
jgi:hypothetical protein